MDIESLRSAVKTALESISAETLAADAGSITAKSVLNFSSGTVKTPQPRQRKALESWAMRQASSGHVREPTAVYRADRYDAGVLAGQAQSIRRLLSMALQETDRLCEGFDRWATAPREVLDEAIRRDEDAVPGGMPEGRTGTG